MYRLFLIIAAVLLVTACTADDETKQGAAGEYCNNSDLDCRPNHVCDRGVCRIQEIEGTNCESMCQKIDFCNSTIDNCLTACLATIEGQCPASNPCPWSDSAVAAFGTCIIDDLTCEQIRTEDVPQLCYESIPLSQTRREVCENFIAASDLCQPGIDTEQVRSRCFTLARTATEASWGRVFECTARINDGFCAEIGDCLNQVFVLDPAIDLGDGQIEFNREL